MKRRNFIKRASLTGLGLAVVPSIISCETEAKKDKKAAAVGTPVLPIVVATWRFHNATKAAWEVLEKGGASIDAIEAGCRIEEADLKNTTVGNGATPDRDGNVTLDACIMNKKGDYGAVVCMENIAHPISVARKVMEETPHVLLAGKGAEQFAVSQGFKRENLLTESSRKAWEKWKVKSEYKPIINIENHDTIGMLAIDKNGDISGGCTTSGLAYKMAGRVGDSAIIGSGLFIDNTVGGATATGMGEEVLKTVGSYLIVELMRQGRTPQEACEEGVKRIVESNPNYKNFQVGYVALNKQGEYGCYCIHGGFGISKYQEGKQTYVESNAYTKKA
ncbi:N(4)-(Beta-N-acetylglucosaminyl)-L-asparaginase [Polaribacter huanghezhanensis]|uniref:N(4)-(beta-N-acetylglucosaminyl)-L-asparaginase n=1 Tax=Polaribacter huanghezhanensis TaxID=1354726 RepID=UPI002647B90F|nr:N(4)-(beta-N-acetylglucosaminyl)-L-asparaginase [Polaribacter huanghezhanensis]WKD87020.1 N(4)-(Beta-N-acetylglucosaminyl)-L-asparaginase [Polaribacter huanghezhanensis]